MTNYTLKTRLKRHISPNAHDSSLWITATELCDKVNYTAGGNGNSDNENYFDPYIKDNPDLQLYLDIDLPE